MKSYSPSECWLWGKSLSTGGYAQKRVRGKLVMVHRLVYLRFKGPIPKGYEIDHLCRVRHCINPAHLEAVTHQENVLRGISPSAQCAKKIYCKYGHPLTPDNTLDCMRKSGRYCKICHRRRVRECDKKRYAKLTPEQKAEKAKYLREWRLKKGITKHANL